LLTIDSGVAGADLVSGDGNTTLSAQNPSPCGPGGGSNCTPASGSPYSSGQQITVSVGPNSTLSTAGQEAAGAPAPDGAYVLEECEDPGGTTANLPSSFSGCEAGTIDTEDGDPATGAVSTATGFTVYALPDVGTVGGPTMTASPAKCGLAPNYCVIGIFAANPNSGNPGFGRPHLWSAPFQVANVDGTDQGNSPGDGTPEVPLAIGLPLAAMGVVGIVLVRNRRRHHQAA
jgi:hypothetical protein